MKLISLIVFLSLSLHNVNGLIALEGELKITSSKCKNGEIGSNLKLDRYILVGLDADNKVIAQHWTWTNFFTSKGDARTWKSLDEKVLARTKKYVVVLMVRAVSMKYDNPIFYGFYPKMWQWDQSSYSDVANPFYDNPWRIDSLTFTMTHKATNKKYINFKYKADDDCDNPGTWIGNHGTYRLDDVTSNVPTKGEVSNMYYHPRFQMILT